MVEFAHRGSAQRRSTTALRALPGVRDVRHDDGHMALATSELHLTVPALLDLLRGVTARR